MDERLNALAAEVGENLGFEVDDIELLGSGGRALLRITIDKPGGIGVDNCEAFSRDMSALLDVEDIMRGRYTLEVSSPGLDRALKKPRHFEKSVGKLVRVVPLEKVEGRNFLVGKLLSADGEKITLAVEEAGEVSIPLAGVKKARLEPEI